MNKFRIIYLLIAVILFTNFTSCKNPRAIDNKVSYIIIAQKNGSWGVLDTTNKWIIPNKYETIGVFSEGLCPICLDGNWGYIDIQGTEFIPFQFEKACEFHNGYAPAKSKGKWGIINTDGDFVIEPTYELIDAYSDGYWRAIHLSTGHENKGEFHADFIDSTGKIVKGQGTYLNPKPWSEGYAAVYTEMGQMNIAGLLDKNGKINSLNSFFAEIERFHSGTAIASSNESLNFALINYEGKIIYTAPNNYSLQRCNGNEKYIWLESVFDHKNKGVIDFTGKLICDTMYDEVGMPNDGFIPVCKEGKWGFVNLSSGKIQIPAAYPEAVLFSEHYFLVTDSLNYGYVSETNELIIPFQYTTAQPFHNGFAPVYKGDKAGIINTNGKTVVPFVYDEISSRISNGYFAVRKNDKWGVVNSAGKEIIPTEYSEFSYFKVLKIKGNSFLDPLIQ